MFSFEYICERYQTLKVKKKTLLSHIRILEVYSFGDLFILATVLVSEYRGRTLTAWLRILAQWKGK